MNLVLEVGDLLSKIRARVQVPQKFQVEAWLDFIQCYFVLVHLAFCYMLFWGLLVLLGDSDPFSSALI